MHIEQNYTGAYIAIDRLEALVNKLLVWQSSCKSKLVTCPLNSKSVSPAAWRCSACKCNIDKRLARKLVWLRARD